jgi:hypothetical protein
MDELGSPVGNVGSEAGDPLQVVVVPVAGRHPLFPVIGDGPLGKVTHFRILVRIDVEAAGRGGSPDHVKPHSQRIRNVISRYYSQLDTFFAMIPIPDRFNSFDFKTLRSPNYGTEYASGYR